MSPEQPETMSITLEARSVLSYAMAHNEIPVISRLVVSEPPRDVHGARLLLEVSDATGVIGESQEIILDLQVGRPTVLADLTLRLEPAAMLQIEEQRPGAVRARLEIDGEVYAEQVARVRVLAAHQWLATPPALALELLASHVMPNHPAIAELMREVATRLQSSTGSPSLEGYQSGAERVDRIVEAVYAAMQARRIGYAEPPASWGDAGQKIRTPGEVLEGRVGTCLDTVVVMAAALEQTGVRPLLWLVRGHAFLGYWREQTSLGTVAEFDSAGVVNRVDLGQIRLVETTGVTQRAEPMSFTDAQRSPYATYLAGDLERIIGVVDVHQARSDRIVPLPARTRDTDGLVHVTLYSTAETNIATPAAVQTQTSRSQSPTTAEPARVTRWKNALLDLSLRNRLINFTPRSALSLTVPSDGLGALEDQLHQSLSITLRASDEVAAIEQERGIRAARDLPQSQLADLLSKRIVHVDVTEAAYQSRLRGLAYKARTITEETGANNLYLSLGTLVWDLGGRSLRSPMILVPVTLKAASRGGRYRLSLDEAGSSTPNYCLIEKLRQTHGLDIPGLAEPTADNAGIDLDAAFDATRRAIAERGLPFRVEPTADLAVLQFAKFRLWKDLDDNWSAFTQNPLVNHLVQTPTDAFADPIAEPSTRDLDGLDERCPVPADSSQLRAIVDAVAGRTFVLEGPPGTGKSQTITNLLTHAVAEGKRVLFVAEKRAALDVVQKRLNAVGMGPLSLDLHDKGSKPAIVREQISSALDLVVSADVQDHDVKVEELRSARRGLARYAYRVHERNAIGFSLYGARDAALSYGDEITPLPIPELLLTSADPDTLARVKQLFSTLPDVADLARPRPEHPWVFIDRAGEVDTDAVHAAARRIDAVIPALAAELGPALAAARTPQDLSTLGALVGSRIPLHVLDEVRTPRWTGAVEQILTEFDQFVAAAHPGLDVVTPKSLTLPIAEIDGAAKAAATSGFFGRKKRLIAVREQLTPVIRDGMSIPPKRLTELTASLMVLQGATGALAARIQAIPGMYVPRNWTPFAAESRPGLSNRVDQLRSAASSVDATNSDPDRARFAEPLRAALQTGANVDPGPVHEASAAVTELAKACGVSTTTLGAWAGEQGLLGRWRSTATERAVGDPQLGSLRRWLDLLNLIEPLRSAGLTDARSMVLSGQLEPDDARRSFELGLAQNSVDERLKNTGLAAFDISAHERSIARFGTASRAAREHLTTVLPQQVVGARAFNSAAAGGRVGQLRRQLTMRRGGMKVRELMSTYGELITQVLPCVLVSPDSLARFFPATAGLFDIVVFDEASQVRVADAVGAMGRGRSVVVVGDSKQMPPTSFAESAFAGDDIEPDSTGDTVEDEESILTECVQARVERHRLTWHYRSQDESLIAFSNQHYYEGKLSSFPAPAVGNAAVSLVQVGGQFHRSGKGALLRTNPIEAEAVVAEVRRRFDASPAALPSIGVVTFNLQQRAHIEGLLRDVEDSRIVEALDDSEGLFVKNLENVQGDERDVILFSTAFSANQKGVLPLNFGPLNRVGGERRLNVAVTRARRQIMVFSSFEPSDMRTEDTSSIGVKHLRTYLDMAAHGPSVLPGDPRRRTTPDRHRDQIALELQKRGLTVRTNVGLSDFTLDLVLADPSAPDQPLVAVLLDGPTWANRLTARDRDALPQEVLAGVLGWPAVERVWLPTWLADPDEVVDRLVDAVQGAHRNASSEGTEVQPTLSPETPDGCETDSSDLQPAEPDLLESDLIRSQSSPPMTIDSPSRSSHQPTSGYEQLYAPKSSEPNQAFRTAPAAPAPANGDIAWSPRAEVFVPWTVRPLGAVDVLDSLPFRWAAERVTAAILEVVTAEGPIHTERLARLVANSFGLNRVVGSRKSAILAHLPQTLRTDSAEPVIWPTERNPDHWTGFRRSASEKNDRPIEHIALREIGNAMVASVKEAAGFHRDELHREVLQVFGMRRRTASVLERLDTALDLAIRSHRLQTEPDGLIIARS